MFLVAYFILFAYTKLIITLVYGVENETMGNEADY